MGQTEATGAPGGRAAWLLPLVSAVTLVWLVLELFAIVTIRATTWPFSALTMFSEPRSEAVELRLVGATAAGERAIDEDDIGLAGRNQLYAYVRNRLVRVEGASVTPRRSAAGHARTMMALYERRNDEPLERLAVEAVIIELPLDGDEPEQRFRVLSVRP